MKNCCIIVPVYKEFIDLCNEELIALNQVYKILGSHPIYFIGPDKVNWEAYLEDGRSRNVFPKAKEFSQDYFSGIQGYNELLISSFFYERFDAYEFMLIYQLDAYVFRDELDNWCKKGYDYIGAPWFDLDCNGRKFLHNVGNGGFSLRKIQSSLRLLKSLRYKDILEKYKYFNWKGIIPQLPSLIKSIAKAKKIPCQLEEKFMDNEDQFWSRTAPDSIKDFKCNSKIISLIYSLIVKDIFKIAPVKDAIKFSFEVNPSLLFELNNRELPFGCHAWEKYDPEFWKEFIPGEISEFANT